MEIATVWRWGNHLVTQFIIYSHSVYARVYPLFHPFEGNACGIYFMHPNKLLPWPFWLVDPLWPIHVDSCFLFGVLRWIHLSFTFEKFHRISSWLQSNNAKHLFKIVTRLLLWSTVRKCCTHFVSSFPVPRWSFTTNTIEWSIDGRLLLGTLWFSKVKRGMVTYLFIHIVV